MKRILLVLLICLAIPVSSFSAAAFVQAQKGTYASGSTWTVSAFTTTSGNLLVGSVFLFASNSFNDVGSGGVADDINGTWTSIDNQDTLVSSQNFQLRTFYIKNITGGSTTITITAGSSAIDEAYFVVHEVSGLDTTSPLDQHTITSVPAPGTGTDAITTGNVTPSANGEYIYSSGMICFFHNTLTHGTDFTIDGQTANFNASEYYVQPTAAAHAGTFTVAVDGATYNVSVVTFKAAAGGGGGGGTTTTGSVKKKKQCLILKTCAVGE